MADDDNEEKAASASAEGKPSVLGPLLALLGVCVIGALLVVGVVSLLSSDSDSPNTTEVSPSLDEKPLMDRALPLPLGDVMVNVKGEGGRRYVKVTVEIWFPKEVQQDIERPEIRNRIIQAAEQRLSTFDMQELNSEFIHDTMSKAFADQINKELRIIYGKVGTDTVYVDDVVLTNLLVQ